METDQISIWYNEKPETEIGKGESTVKLLVIGKAGEPVTAGNPMLQAEEEVEKKILYSSHVGGITASSFARGYAMFWSDLEKVAAGGRPGHIVNGL